MVLGSIEVAPLSMAAAYAAFAAEGKYCKPLAVKSITDRDGKSLKVPGSTCTQALEENVARGVVYALKPVLVNGTAAGNGIDRPAAGKTGTTDDSKDTWFVGFTPQRATAVWVGDNPNPVDGKMRKSINGRKIGGHRYGNIYGATLAAPLWRTIMKVAHEGLPKKDWANPGGKLLDGTSTRLPNVVGKSVADAKKNLEAAGYTVSIGSPVPSDMGPDRVAETSPKPGSRVAPDSTVTLLPGDGKGGHKGDGDDEDGDDKDKGDDKHHDDDDSRHDSVRMQRSPITMTDPAKKKPTGGR
jgi:membrane peptidoglycan carboxypeptidase